MDLSVFAFWDSAVKKTRAAFRADYFFSSSIDINLLTPLEALNKLSELKKKASDREPKI